MLLPDHGTSRSRNPDGQAGRKTSGFTVTTPSTRPSIIRLTPSSGLNTNPVNITNLSGINFVDGSLITLTRTGYENISATDALFVNSTFMTCVLPVTGAAPGPWNVTVTNPDGQAGRKTCGFTVTTPSTRPAITRLTPSSGLNTASVNITNLSGINFVDGSLITLTRTGYENISATEVLFINSTFMTCVLPVTGAAPGPWNVTVTNPDGQAGRKTSGFTVTALKIPLNARVISSTVPAIMESGRNYSVSVVMSNTGTMNWSESSQIHLGAPGNETSDAARFGLTRILLPDGLAIKPGEQYQFNFTMTAPTTGNYTPVLQMIQESYQWFGEQVSSSVQVMDSDPESVTVNFTANTSSGSVPLAIQFSDLSTGLPNAWNWSFGDNSSSNERNPVHIYNLSGNYSVSLTASNSHHSDTLTIPGYISALNKPDDFRSESIFQSIPGILYGSESYIAYIQMKNTGSSPWIIDPTSPDRVRLEAIGNNSEDSDLIWPKIINMSGSNKTVVQGETYDFFFPITAPYEPCNLSQQYQLKHDVNESFGENVTLSTSIILNPYNPVILEDGNKTYNTTFFNSSAGVKVIVSGKKAYIDELEVYNNVNPRFMYHPARIGNVLNIQLNETFDTAAITLSYDPGNVADPSHLGMVYYNETSREYVQISSNLDVVNHTVTGTTTHQGIFMIMDINILFSLCQPIFSEWCYLPINTTHSFPLRITNLQTGGNWWYFEGWGYPPGRYQIVATGNYNDVYLGFGDWRVGSKAAWRNYDNDLGMWIKYGKDSKPVSQLVKTGNILEFNHTGGSIGVWNNDPVFYDNYGDLTYTLRLVEEISDEDSIFDILLYNDLNPVRCPICHIPERYRFALGILFGQTLEHGGLAEELLTRLFGDDQATYSFLFGEKVTSSPEFFLGKMVGSIIPETAIRDFIDSIYRGDSIGAILNACGLLQDVSTALKNGNVIAEYLAKNPGNGFQILKAIRKTGYGMDYLMLKKS